MKYNLRIKYLMERAMDTRYHHTHRLNILGEEKDSEGVVQYLYLVDTHGMVVNFPMTLVRANRLDISGGALNVSNDLYRTWYEKKVQEQYKSMTSNVRANFHAIVSNSAIILKDSEYARIRLPHFLQSHALYVSTCTYSLGALLDSWSSSEDLLTGEGIYLIKISGIPLRASNRYLGWDAKNKKLVSGSLSQREKNWDHYLGVFQRLTGMQRTKFKNSSDILALERMFLELQIGE